MTTAEKAASSLHMYPRDSSCDVEMQSCISINMREGGHFWRIDGKMNTGSRGTIAPLPACLKSAPIFYYRSPL